jgi:hypothetical protein
LKKSLSFDKKESSAGQKALETKPEAEKAAAPATTAAAAAATPEYAIGAKVYACFPENGDW